MRIFIPLKFNSNGVTAIKNGCQFTAGLYRDIFRPIFQDWTGSCPTLSLAIFSTLFLIEFADFVSVISKLDSLNLRFFFSNFSLQQNLSFFVLHKFKSMNSIEVD
eukprot:TRINITY_DN44623_c0_g1_i1.p2 TRINITY_DN44623_c0_g1~~TRINITY_DN44623_c0_g1_i1.p2  ORF type:complete len:105 (-),score=1.40 TRINITY_DN44623_c0_g1_i1:74-388(-)